MSSHTLSSTSFLVIMCMCVHAYVHACYVCVRACMHACDMCMCVCVCDVCVMHIISLSTVCPTTCLEPIFVVDTNLH